MAAVRTPVIRRAVARLAPLLLLAAVVPLLAPTCGGFAEGVKTFSRGSLIIPMDVCYQCSIDSATNTWPGSTALNGCAAGTYTTPAPNPTTGEFSGNAGGRICPQNVDPGDVIKAYGLVYQLIRAGVPVYWIIEPAKTHFDDYDLTVQYNGGAPVYLYDWTNGSNGAAPTAAATIDYMGGVFVVDGTDFADANAVLQGKVDTTCATGCELNKTRFGGVNVHVANVAFQAPVKRTMAGGWSAGGAVAPKLALLDIGSGYWNGSSAKNSEIVIRGYLQKAGLDFPNAGGNSAASAHGQIYDRLVIGDFLPTTPGDWKTTKLYQNGYQILWVPHWIAPGSCSNVSSCGTTQYPDSQIEDVLETVSSFVTDATDTDLIKPGVQPAGLKDLFAECAGLGSFEGVNATTSTSTVDRVESYSPLYVREEQALTHFHNVVSTTPGMAITEDTPSYAKYWGNFANPIMQIGDYEFVPQSGAISTYRETAYQSGVIPLISEWTDDTRDIFTLRPAVLPPAANPHGTVVYMGGHSYSGSDTSGQYATAGTRLVLNTLFNLGASCVATGVTCSTGALGACGQGAMTCDADGNQVCSTTVSPATETCNGIDDDCDGLVDENLARSCYDGPAGTEGVGLCHGGTQQCERKTDGTYGYGACVGVQLPTTEICNGANDDCDKSGGVELIDEGLTKSCYSGPSSTLDPITGLPMGICHSGTQSCSGGEWGTCSGQALPEYQECPGEAADQQDNNCNGLVDEGCGCVNGTHQNCYAGQTGTQGNGKCKPGTQTCESNAWNACRTCTEAEAALPPEQRATLDCQILPAAEICGNGNDDDCDGLADGSEAACNVCTTQVCYTGAAGTLPVYPDPIIPGTPDLPSDPDEVRVCRRGTSACTDGVYGSCLGQVLPSDETCDGKDNDCDGHIDNDLNDNGVIDGVEVAPACGGTFLCVNGVCVSSSCGTEQGSCQTGYECVAGKCAAIACEGTGSPCEPGVICSGTDTCQNPCDPAYLVCGAGTFCAGGVCTGGACYAEGCDAGGVCRNGTCMSDPCAGVTCPGSTFCRDGDCVQACAYVACVEGQICGDDGFCRADPCSGASCRGGQVCIDGSCVENLCTDSVRCGNGKDCRQYRDSNGEWTATCFDNPCSSVTCPTGVCLARAALDCTAEPCIRAQCFASDNLAGTGTLPALKTEGGGCGCATGSPSPAAVLLGLLLLPLARRRRVRAGPGFPALLLAVAVTGTLAGCPKEKTTGTDPADCVQSCNVDSLVAPWVASVTPSSGQKGSPVTATIAVTGDRFEPGASVRVFPAGTLAVGNVTVVDATHVTMDLDLSAAEEGQYLLRVVNPDKVISNLFAYDSVLMAPIITAVSTDPASVAAPDPATVIVTGSRFTPASECRLQAGTFTLSLPTTMSAPGTELRCALDTTQVPPGVLEVWVMNEGGESSDRTPPWNISVAGQLAATAISPPAIAASCSNTPTCTLNAVHSIVTLYGSGFTGTSVVSVTDPLGVVTPTVTKSFLDPTRLQARIDITGIASAALPFELEVTVSNGGAPTTPLTLYVAAVQSSTTVETLSPQSAYQGTASTTLTLTGADIPTAAEGTRVQILAPGGSFVDLGGTAGGGTSISATLDLTDNSACPSLAGVCPAGDYEVRLRFPDGSTSVTFPFRVLSNVPTLWSYTATPIAQQQGSSVSVVVEGTTFFANATLSLKSGGVTVNGPITPTLTPAAPPEPAKLTGTFDLTGMDTGVYSLVAKNTTSGDSNALSFSVTPGRPTLTSLTPTALSQSNPTPLQVVSFAGTNFAKPDASGVGGSMVFIQNRGLDIPATPPPTAANPTPEQPWLIVASDKINVTSPTLMKVTLDLRDTVPAAACTSPDRYYYVKVVNPPGGALMETVEKSFCVTP